MTCLRKLLSCTYIYCRHVMLQLVLWYLSTICCTAYTNNMNKYYQVRICNYIYIYRVSVCKHSHNIFFTLKKGRLFQRKENIVLACRASTQVTTTTLQKNLTAEIKWYMISLGLKYTYHFDKINTERHIYTSKQTMFVWCNVWHVPFNFRREVFL